MNHIIEIKYRLFSHKEKKTPYYKQVAMSWRPETNTLSEIKKS